MLLFVFSVATALFLFVVERVLRRKLLERLFVVVVVVVVVVFVDVAIAVITIVVTVVTFWSVLFVFIVYLSLS